jgi:hypothetical protein
MSIFIVIASYCDNLLIQTLCDAHEKAENPDALHFGVVEQNHAEARAMVDALSFRRQIAYLRIDPIDARGLGWARHLAYSLYEDEAYLLQIDSHMVFEPGWDRSLIDQLQALSEVSSKPILSTYPPPFVMENGEPLRKPWEEGLIHPFHPAPDARISLEEPAFLQLATEEPGREPVKTSHMAGGFFFTLGSYAEEVLPDPFIYFKGEEHGVAIRAFTHGWDIFAPKHVPLYHLYRERSERTHTLHWNSAIDEKRPQSWLDRDERSVVRLRRLFFGSGLPGVYGLGNERSLEDFRRLSGIDYPRMTLPREPRPELQDNAAIAETVDIGPVAVLAPLLESANAGRYLVLQCMQQSRPPDLIVIVQRQGEAALAATIDDLRPAIRIAWLYLENPVSEADAYRIAIAHALDARAQAIFLCDAAQCYPIDFVASGVAALADHKIAFAEKRTAQMRGPTVWSGRATTADAGLAKIAPTCLSQPMAESFGLAMAANPDRPPHETLKAVLANPQQ